MTEPVTILIERNGRKQFSRFIELFQERSVISVKEIRSKIPKSTFYDFVLRKINTINESIHNINPDLGPFITPSFNNHNGRITMSLRINCDIEVLDDDPNFFRLRLKHKKPRHALN
ncbi:MAG: hypothetical protein ABH879_02055 [archaeon]